MEPKLGRLKKEKQIAALFDKGAVIKHFPLLLFYAPSAEWQSGVSVSKRLFKRAVDRNRVKRLLRESVRGCWPLIISSNHAPCSFMVLYIGKTLPTFEEVGKCSGALFAKFIKRHNSDNNE